MTGTYHPQPFIPCLSGHQRGDNNHARELNDSTVLAAPPEAVKKSGKSSPSCCSICGTLQRACTSCSVSWISAIDSDVWLCKRRTASTLPMSYCNELASLLGLWCRQRCRWGAWKAYLSFVQSPSWLGALTQHLVDNKVDLPPHPLEDKILFKDMPMRARTATPTKLLQVYVDNFCNAATQSVDGHHIPLIRQALIHGVHAVFPKQAVTGHTRMTKTRYPRRNSNRGTAIL
jgi:hypothetical protein